MIENVECDTKEELEQRERYFIESMVCCNKNIPTRAKKEWRTINSEVLKEKKKKYYEDNIEKIQKRAKQYREDNQEKIKEINKQYRENNKKKIKEIDKLYYKNNKEIRSAYGKQYYQDNIDKFKQKNKITVRCVECSMIVTKINLKRHQRSKNCLSCVK